LQLNQSLENQVGQCTNLVKEFNLRLDQLENATYEFRKESFTGIHEIEKIFLKKNDNLRRGLQDVCKTLNISNPMVLQ
jgi:hypothetical protein